MKNHTARNMFMLLGSILLCMLMCAGCAFFKPRAQEPPAKEAAVNNTTEDNIELIMIDDPFKQRKTPQKAAAPLPQKTAYAGKTIAVPAPQFEKSTAADSWMTQFLQDSLTGQFAVLSGMTVLDRKNESVVIAEQKLAESGLYSFDNAAAFGQLANAEYVLTGSVQKLPSRYALTFRVNDITTNEIKASFNGQYTPADIENGKAVQDAVIDLFKGLGIPLTQQQIAGITKNRSAVTGTKKLAQGMAAEKSGDFITALSFLSDSSESGNREAASVISGMLSVSTPANIRERANYYKEQTAKWNKIWKDLEQYMKKNYPILVYDFSNMSDKISASGNTVKLTWLAGVKLVPNRKALVVYNTVWNEWKKIKSSSTENIKWIQNIRPYDAELYLHYNIKIGLYNKYGELLGKIWESDWGSGIYYAKMRISKMEFENQSIPPQFRLFNNEKFYEIVFWDIPIDDKFTDVVTPRIIEFSHLEGSKKISNLSAVMSLSEWEQYLKEAE